MQRLIATLLLLSFSALWFAAPVKAWELSPDQLSMGYGQNVGNKRLTAQDLRLALQWRVIEWPIIHSGWQVEGHLVTSLNQWNSSLDPDKASSYGSNSITALMLLPSLRLAKAFGPSNSFIEAGVGGGFMSGKALKKNANSPVDKSSSFNFELMAGAGSRFGSRQQYEINFKWLHYSNANMKTPNESLNFQVLSFGYWY